MFAFNHVISEFFSLIQITGKHKVLKIFPLLLSSYYKSPQNPQFKSDMKFFLIFLFLFQSARSCTRGSDKGLQIIYSTQC